MRVFVDSSAFYAAVDSDDAHHLRAKEVLATSGPLLTTDHVLVECWLLIQRRQGRQVADAFWHELRLGAALVEQVGVSDLEVAWRIGEDFNDQAFSIVDRTSFAVMQRLGVARAATFDDRFAVFRFGPGRSRAFEVLR